MLRFKVSDMDEIRATSLELLETRAKDIDENGELNGRFWFIALVNEANAIVLRRKAWRARHVTA